MSEIKKRLLPEDIASVITDEEYIIRQPGLTICILTLKNGAKQVGVNYGAIDPDRQNWEYGQQEARKQALEKVWEAEGYLLRQRILQRSIQDEIIAKVDAEISLRGDLDTDLATARAYTDEFIDRF